MEPTDRSTRYYPKEGLEIDELITSSYDAFVRLERRNLLIVSTTILFSFISSISPSESTVFGFTFNNLNESIYYTLLTILNLYFLSAFSIYAYPGYRASKNKRKEMLGKGMTITSQMRRWQIDLPNVGHSIRFNLWFFINFYLPVALGVLALVTGVYKIA
ncbi:MAG: hypothetical protein VYE29_04700 [Pseudomonadota bacterium]|nr:hypothetical protein [Pseudomonadota bacterium]